MTLALLSETTSLEEEAVWHEWGRTDGHGATGDGAAIYYRLTGHSPAEADIGDDRNFDTHVFASILAVAAMDGKDAAADCGLSPDDLGCLMATRFPACPRFPQIPDASSDRAADDEVAIVRALLLANLTQDCEESRWLASMVARRTLEANHLWEDLGLRERGELTRLLERHFAPLASRNTRGMRWKRFFYRQLCEDDGFLMCATPVCTDCRDFELCFGAEDGESRLARRKREGGLASSQHGVGG